MLKYKRIGVTVKSGLEEKGEAVEEILCILQDLGAELFVDLERMKGISCAKKLSPFTEKSRVDLMLIIGGDGTILRTVRELAHLNVPILSVNRGTVGFLAETHLDEAATLLPKLLGGSGVIEERKVLHIEAFRGKKKLFDGHALNEAVIAQGTIARLVDLRTTVNGEALTTYHADGLIVATPTGSTAYSLSAGGPIVHPKLSAVILTPINPHSFTQKPIVIPGDDRIEVEVISREVKFKDAEVVLTIDGQVYIPLMRHDVVRVRIDPEKTVKFLRRKQDTFFGTLREKLKWGERLEVS